jgi:hypothetical protein
MLLLKHEDPMVRHDHLEYVVLWKHKPKECLNRESLRDASTIRLNEVCEILLEREIIGNERWITQGIA